AEVSDAIRGVGIALERDGQEQGVLTLRASVVEENRAIGVLAEGSTLTIETTAIRDTRPEDSDQKFGRGVEVQFDPVTLMPSELTLRDSSIDGNRDVGVYVAGANGHIERCLIQGTL